MQDHSKVVVGNNRPPAALTFPESAAASANRAQLRSGAEGDAGTDDVELMRRVAGGDTDARRQVARRLLRRVEGLCRAVLRSSEEVLDARRRSMVEILTSAHSFPAATTLESWADRISVRTALHIATPERRAQPAQLELDTTSSPSESVLLARRYLDGISERQRMVVVMRHGLEYTVEEIATMTGITHEGVKSDLLHARSILRRMCRQEPVPADVASDNAVG